MSLMKVTAVKSAWTDAGPQWINPDHIHRIFASNNGKGYPKMKAMILFSADENAGLRVEESVEELLALYKEAKNGAMSDAHGLEPEPETPVEQKTRKARGHSDPDNDRA